ncbi:oxidoreductase [Plantactinospora sp. BC1]|uniref:Gfo/Idh/MocA family protein n=1 Tax=Plantactinospora sp. BC1 TaxID=2108470 RepID=UPI000D1650F3|nr:Gfo/Idh/MocA family oxidoreductase [Plantactinospora sp. BC1]AVT33717.1 oxidoreductase [Plantactinospora sp. BC1]
MTGRTRWGILGTGRVAGRFTEDLRLLPDAEVVAVGSRTHDAAQAFATRHGIGRAHGSWAALAADPEVDVVYVATPHAVHHAAATTCLEAGKAVLCEKPCTLDRATSAELVDLARERGLFLMEAMWTRCNPAVRRMCDLVTEGAIGEVAAVVADFGFAAPPDPADRLRARALGGGALLEMGVYPITIAHLVLGAPAHIRAWAALSGDGVDENTGMVFGYDTGALATLSCGLLGGTPNTASITGTRGRITLPRPCHRPSGLVLDRDGAAPEEIALPFEGNGYQFEAAEVHRCLHEGLVESPLVSHATTLEVMGVLDTIRAQIGVTYP